MTLLDAFKSGLQDALTSLQELGQRTEPASRLRGMDHVQVEQLPLRRSSPAAQSIRAPVSNALLFQPPQQYAFQDQPLRNRRQLAQAIIEFAQEHISVDPTTTPKNLSVSLLREKVAELRSHLQSPQSSPFLPQHPSLIRLLQDLEPEGTLNSELMKNFNVKSPRQQTFLTHLFEYIQRLVSATKDETNQVQTALQLFPPANSTYACAGGTLNRLITARQCLDTGPNALLRSVFADAAQSIMLRARPEMPSEFEVHGPLAVQSLFGASSSRLEAMDTFARTPVPYLKAEAAWNAYRDLDNAPQKIEASLDHVVNSIGNLEAVTLSEAAAIFKPFNLTPWTEDGESIYTSTAQLKEALLLESLQTLMSSEQPKTAWSEIVASKPSDLPDFQTLQGPQGRAWLLKSLNPQAAPNALRRDALQALALLGEALDDHKPYQLIRTLSDLGAGSIQRGITRLNSHNTILEQQLTQRIKDRSQHLQGTSFLQWLSDKTTVSFYAMLENKASPEEIRRTIPFIQQHVIHESGNSIMHLLASAGNANAVLALQAQSPYSPNRRNQKMQSPLFLAAAHGHTRTVNALVAAGAWLESTDAIGQTPLHIAACNGHEASARALILAGATVNALDGEGETPLSLAAISNSREMIELLLQEKAEVDQTGRQDLATPLIIASQCGNIDVVNTLIEAKADCNARTVKGFTPLHIAAQTNNHQLVRALLAAGAKIDGATNKDLTALHSASLYGRIEAAKALIEGGADLHAKTKGNMTPLAFAQRSGFENMITLLTQAGART